MQSGLLKQSNGTRTSAIWCLALAVITFSGAGLQAQAAHQGSSRGIVTETQLHVESTLLAGRNVSTFTVHVEPTAGDANASGVVSLVDSGDSGVHHPVASSVLDENGNAKLQIDDLQPGTHGISAKFQGDGTFASSQSPETQVAAATTGVPDFSVSAAQTTLSAVQGNAVTTILTLTPLNGFSGYVTLSCSSLPQYSACNFVPVNVFIGNGTTSPSTMTVATQAPTGPTTTSQLSGRSKLIFAFLFPGLFCVAKLGLRGRRTWQQLGMVLMVVIATGAMSGCSQRYGYLKHQPAPLNGTAVGTTNFILEEQSISGTTVITHQTTLALTVTAAPTT